MKTLVLIAALGVWPAFQPEGNFSSRPLIWEAPVSGTADSGFQPGLQSEWPPHLIRLSPDLAEKIRAAAEVQKTAGPLQAAEHLGQAGEIELILLRAGFHLSAGQLKNAQADYQKVLDSNNRTAPRALALAGYKNALRRRIAAGEKNLYWDLIKCLKDEWRNEEALAWLPLIWDDPQVSDEVKKRLAREEPVMALRLGRYDRAAELLAEPKGRSEVQWLAQTENRRGNFLRASQLRENLLKQFGAGKARTRELETSWSILAKGGLYEEAEALAIRHPEVRKLPDYHWRTGLAALSAGELESARLAFEALLAQSKNVKRHPGARYYLARTLEKEGRSSEALEHYRRLAAGPFGYYHILAQGKIDPEMSPLNRPEHCLVCQGDVYNRKGLQLSAPLSGLLETGPGGGDDQSLGFYLWITEKGLSSEGLLEAARRLSRLEGPVLAGGKAVASLDERIKSALAAEDWPALLEAIRSNPEAVRSAVPAARDLWLPLAATLAARGGDYRLAVSLMARIPNPEPKGLKRWSHPLVFSRQVLAARRLHGLSPSLVLALIRTESAYQADIMSASNARGLMQLLPATASKVAAALGESEPGDLDLFEPDLNIRYGTWYLAALVEGFGSVELALAGYNGGPYNIKSLIAAKEGMPLDIFIESLPFEETSNYVKRITESRYIYEMVYLGRAGLPDLTAPVRPPGPALPDF